MADVETQNALIEAHALARHVRMSPQKARLVMDLIRGQKAQDGAPCSQGFDREASALEKGQEVVGRFAAAEEVRRVMGQKTHPYGFRLGYNKPWKSRWFADKDYADLLHEDVKLRKELKEKLKSAGISSIDIERAANKLVVRIYTARPGIIIGRKGAEIDKLKQEV